MLIITVIIVITALCRKNCKKYKYFIIALSAVGVVISIFAVWFYAPTSCEIPNKPVYQRRYGSYEWIDNEEESRQLTQMLKSFELRRKSIPTQGLVPVDKVIPGGIDPDAWIVFAIYDGDEMEYGVPKLWGYCSVLLSRPSASTIICVDEGILGHYEIRNIDAYIELLMKMQ